MPTITQIKGLINQRDNLITSIIKLLEKTIDAAQQYLLQLVVTGIVDGLDKEDDVIKNTAANRARILLMERIYNKYAKEKGLEVVAAVAQGVNRILQFNDKYFALIGPDIPLAPVTEQVKVTVQNWLGLTVRNTVAKGGYLDSLVQDTVTKQRVKDLILNATITQKGFYETRANLKTLIAGSPEKDGLIATRYSQVTHDVFQVVDRTTANMYGQKMKLACAIFAGPVVKGSRPWCIVRKQKVFTQREIADFEPPTAKPIPYDPFLHLGGFGCLDKLNWISYSIAKALRPDLPPENECFL